MINEIESGAPLYPKFFSHIQCTGGQWPTSDKQFTLDKININIKSDICNVSTYPDIYKNVCPVPMIWSMLLPDNVQISFKAHDNKYILLEAGATNIRAKDLNTTFPNVFIDINSAPILEWYSSNKECKYLFVSPNIVEIHKEKIIKKFTLSIKN